MCEQTYIGCPGCGATVNNIVHQESQTETIGFPLDEFGNIDREQEPSYGEDMHHEDLGLHCQACGWRGVELESECVDETCECEQCIEPEPDDPGPDPDKIVVLVRTQDRYIDLPTEFQKFHELRRQEVPPELLKLYRHRAIRFQPLPRWRAAEIHRDVLSIIDYAGIEIDFSFQMPDEAAYKLILPGFDPTKANYKGAPDAGHVAACA